MCQKIGPMKKVSHEDGGHQGGRDSVVLLL